MQISVIIPTYKSWNIIDKCLQSLQNQSFEGSFEILVVDNEENSIVPENLRNYQNVRFLHETKPGSYAARNTAIEAAKGEILAFTDADCIPHKDWLKNGVELLEKTENIGIVGGNVKLFYLDENKLNSAETYDKYTAFRIKEYVSFGNCVTANWFSYRKTLIDFGCFDSNLKSGGDTKLSQKISAKLALVYGENVIVYHPARNKVSEIVTKYRRVLGGKYAEKFNKQNKKFLLFTVEYIFRRIKFNLNFLAKGKVKDFFKIAYVHFTLLPSLFFESLKIIATGKTERK